MAKEKKDKIIIISIMSYYARQIFDEVKLYEFRKSPIKQEFLNQKIYVYSAKEDKAIMGYIKIDDIIRGNTDEIIKLTGYDKRNDKDEIIKYYGKDNPKCFALHLYDVTEFDEYLSLKDMRSISKKVDMPQYLKIIYKGNPLYDIITKWDKAFSLNGNLCKNPLQTKKMILQELKSKGDV